MAFRKATALLLSVALAGCVSAPSGPRGAPARPNVSTPPTNPVVPPPPVRRDPAFMNVAGLESVIGQPANGLISQFGQPRLDVKEGDARKLQFSGSACVLDVFLYPTSRGPEPLATYVDARRASDGLAVDRAACVRALKR